jgi:colicin import membrane protein
MTRNNKTVALLTTVALVVAFSMPALAVAAGGASAADTQSSTVAQTPAEKKAAAQAKAAEKRAAAKESGRQAQLKASAAKQNAKQAAAENLGKRVENKLRARKARFDAASANINKRIARVAELADRVEAAGGDVTAVRAKLDLARTELAEAIAIEATTAEQLRAVKDAPDKRAAFRTARSTGREAVAKLKQARFAVRDSAHLLKTEIERLRTSGSLDAPAATQ